MQITRQFAFCPNAFRIDTYKGCSFCCEYCFANMEWMGGKQKYSWAIADMDKVERYFYRAFETDKDWKSIIVELLRHRVPLHCGGMSDPFQHREWEIGNTKRLIDLSNHYDYPIIFSTKTSSLHNSYYDILNPKLHAFQISIMGWSNDYIKKWERNTPTAQERCEFVQLLRNDFDIWCSVRIQPVIDVEEALLLCRYLGDTNVSYVTVEHFKATYDATASVNAFLDKVQNKQDFISTDGRIQTKRDVKLRNIQRIQEVCNKQGIKVGVGDNDLHYLSQSRNCCGTDLIGGAFDNYLKYNLTYMCTGEFDTADMFIPTKNPRKHINDQKYGSVIDCKTYVDDYIRAHPDYLGQNRENIQKQLFGKSQNSLFN